MSGTCSFTVKKPVSFGWVRFIICCAVVFFSI
jgi:hypothetical protein